MFLPPYGVIAILQRPHRQRWLNPQLQRRINRRQLRNKRFSDRQPIKHNMVQHQVKPMVILRHSYRQGTKQRNLADIDRIKSLPCRQHLRFAFALFHRKMRKVHRSNSDMHFVMHHLQNFFLLHLKAGTPRFMPLKKIIQTRFQNGEIEGTSIPDRDRLVIRRKLRLHGSMQPYPVLINGDNRLRAYRSRLYLLRILQCPQAPQSPRQQQLLRLRQLIDLRGHRVLNDLSTNWRSRFFMVV